MQRLKLRCGDRAGEGRVGVAVDQYPVRRLVDDQLLEARQHPRGLIAVPAGADSEIDVGRRKLEIAKLRG
jgi:hypothetical protein